MVRVSRTGIVIDSEPIELLNGRARSIGAVWIDDHYVVSYHVLESGGAALYSLQIGPDGERLSDPVLLSTESTGTRLEAALAGDRIALVGDYLDGPGDRPPWILWMDAQGVPLQPDLTPLPHSSPGDEGSARAGLAWTGEQLLVAVSQFEDRGDPAGTRDYTWWLWRVLPTGEVLDDDAIELVSDSSLEGLAGAQWTGSELHVFGVRAGRLVRQPVVCSCDDEDADSFDACDELDCDDGNPLANPAAGEQCRGDTDEDCDRLWDCEDPDCAATTWQEWVSSLSWGDAGLSWPAVPGASTYDMARGLVSDLQRRADARDGECAASELVEENWADDGRDPPLGDALWYLVRPEGTVCELGRWGTDTVSRDPNVCRRE